MSKVLAVFDFDQTVVNKNSDVVLRDLLPKLILEGDELKTLRKSWTSYMAEVFRLLPQHGFDREVVVNTCQQLEATDGMIELFHYLGEIKAKIVILSDANSEIISLWFAHNLPSIDVEIITNPASWDNDVLKVEPYEHQTSCQLCPKNLCKGSVLSKLLGTSNFDMVLYIGDGKNDFCPSRNLRPCDWVFPRIGYTLDTLLKDNKIESSILPWTSASQIKNKLEEILN